jgi:hypothetical protein
VSLLSHITILCHVVSFTADPSLDLYMSSVAKLKFATLLPLYSLVRSVPMRPCSSILLMCSINTSLNVIKTTPRLFWRALRVGSKVNEISSLKTAFRYVRGQIFFSFFVFCHFLYNDKIFLKATKIFLYMLKFILVCLRIIKKRKTFYKKEKNMIPAI